MKLGAPAGGKEVPLPWRLRRSGGGCGRRLLVWIVLVCCSPILVPLLCLSLPFILIIFICIRSDSVDPSKEEEEEEEEEEIGGDQSFVVLHRYLEDQLKLVLESDVAVSRQRAY